jgi:hypothetical protein
LTRWYAALIGRDFEAHDSSARGDDNADLFDVSHNVIGLPMSSPTDAASRTPNDMRPVIVDGSLALVRSATIRARGYWDKVRGERAMPTRQDINPRGMREFLAHVTLVEIQETAGGTIDYQIRLAGSVIEEVFGAISGKPISETLPPETVRRWRGFMETVREKC